MVLYTICNFNQYIYTYTTVGCSSSKDCSDDEECYSGQCLSPCRSSSNPCPPTAVCQPLSHSASCLCPSGTTGMPLFGCSPLLSCSSDSECSLPDKCIQGECKDPCGHVRCSSGSVCKVIDNKPICQCRPGYTGDGNRGCTRIGCSSDSDCEGNEECKLGRCRDPCNDCGIGAECSVSGGITNCVCPPGTQGNPNISCATSKI